MIKSNLNISGKKNQITGLTVIIKVLNICMITTIIKKIRIFFIENYLKEIVKKTDLYLHYSNYIIFEKNSFLPALKFILLKIRSAGGRISDSADEELNGPDAQFAAIQNSAENLNSFDGVIERYCGVPP